MSENTPGTYIRPIEMLEHEIRDRLADKNAEIASLRAELAEAQDEVLALRSRELYVTAERDRLRAELANKATTAVLERVAAAQSADPGTDDLTVCLALEVADLEAVNSELRAAARRDAEHITRLQEALRNLIEAMSTHGTVMHAYVWKAHMEARTVLDETKRGMT